MSAQANERKGSQLQDHQRLRVRPVVRFVPLDDRRWSIWLGTQATQLAGGGPAGLIPDLLELLDGTRDVASIAALVAERRGVSPGVVRELLARLYEWLILDDDAGYRGDPGDGDLEPFAAQLAWLALGSSLPVAALRRVRAARVAVAGLNGVGEHLALALAGAGVRELRLGRGGAVTAADRGAFLYTPADVGRPAGEALAAALARLRPDCRPSVLAGDAPDAAELEGLDLVVAATRDLHAPAVAELNRACLAARRPLLVAGIDMVQGFVGPLVLPRETPCVECVAARLKQTEGELAGRIRPRPAHVEPAPLAALVANLAAIEALRFLSGAGPSGVAGAQLTVDSRASIFGAIDFVRHPRCRACGPLVDRAPQIVFDVAATLRDPQ